MKKNQVWAGRIRSSSEGWLIFTSRGLYEALLKPGGSHIKHAAVELKTKLFAWCTCGNLQGRKVLLHESSLALHQGVGTGAAPIFQNRFVLVVQPADRLTERTDRRLSEVGFVLESEVNREMRRFIWRSSQSVFASFDSLIVETHSCCPHSRRCLPLPLNRLVH